MKPYPEYKPTGLARLPEIPKHWKSAKLRNLLSIVSKKNHPEQPLLSVVREKGVIRRDVDSKEENHNYIPEDLSNYKVVRKGQFAMNKMKAWQGSYGISQYDGIVSPAYFVFDLHGVSADFFNIAIRSKAYIPYFAQASDGIRVGQWDLSLPRMHEIPFSIPPADEQAQIVRYLDAMTAKINKLIRAKKRQIALLQEQKQAIINQAVTRGLDPDVELKDSGIDWLGPIPKHWTQNKVGHFYKSVLGKMLASTPSSNNDSYEKYLCAKDVHFSGIDLSDLKQMWFSPEEKKKYMLQKGDLLIVEGGAGAGGSAVFNGYEGPVYIQNSIHLLRPQNSKNVVKFLYYWLYSLIGRKYIDFACNKATIPHYTGDKLFETPFLFIPLEEQKQIVAFLDNACEKYNKTISNLNDEISHITEFKNSLISSVITGQVDIRKIALEEVDPADLIAEIDDDSTGEESLEESEE